MSFISLPFARGGFTSVVFGLGVLAMGMTHGQSIDITSHADDDVVTIFTPFAQVPASKFISVEADTTGSIQDVHFGLDGFVSGNDWSNGATGSAGIPIAADTYVANIDLTTGNVAPDAISSLTLRAFAFATGSSGYISDTSILDFDASDSVPIFIDIRIRSMLTLIRTGFRMRIRSRVRHLLRGTRLIFSFNLIPLTSLITG